MPDIYIEVKCVRCGTMCNEVDVNGTEIIVEPCENCMSNERSEGYEEGFEDGRNQ